MPHQPAGTNLQLSADDYRFLQDLVYRDSGIVLDNDKHYLFTSRLAPVVRKHSIPSLTDLCALLRRAQGSSSLGQALVRHVVEAMTTNETLFFREMPQFDALRTGVLPRLLAERKNSSRRLSFWSAAASSGQEAYSLLMMLFEMGLEDWDLNLLGTDLNNSILERARQGRYLQIEVNRGLPVQYMVKYFQRMGLEWQVKDRLRSRVRWRQWDLREPLRNPDQFDIVLCRNVLIYFDVETKRRILGNLRSVLKPGGYLLLGGAETALHLDDRLRRAEVGSCVLYQIS